MPALARVCCSLHSSGWAVAVRYENLLSIVVLVSAGFDQVVLAACTAAAAQLH